MAKKSKKQTFSRGRLRIRLLVTATVCAAFALMTVIGLAATTPASGTVSPSSPTLQFQGGPYSVSNPTSPVGENPPVCTDQTPCGQFALTVNIPAGDTTAYDLTVSVKWTDSGTPTTQGATNSDYDIFVYKGTAPTGTSMGAQGPNANPQEFRFKAASGNYTVYVVPYDVAPDVPFTATVTLAKPEPEVTPTPAPVPPGTPTFTAYMSPQGVGDDAGEPSVGANWKTGRIMYYGGFMEYVLRVTFDDSKQPAGALWETRDLLLAATPRVLGDPILYTDSETGRTFISQLEGGTKQNTMDITDDDGDTLQLSMGSGVNSGYDHQTVGGGPFAPGMTGNGYKNAVYYCAQDAAVANCALSTDGGVTFGPAVPISNITQCTAIHGHVQVAPDGTAYVPDRSCGGEQGVIVSEDNGLTWKLRKATGSTAGEWDPSVGVATDGTLYFGYNGADGRARVQVSHDKGLTWTTPYDVGAQLGIRNSIFPAVVAGDPDRAAFAFIGTTTGGDYNLNEFDGTWYLYVASTLDGGRTWTTVNATPNDPVQRGRVCTDGTTCAAPGGGGDTRNLLDFMGATIDREGRVVVGYADGCITSGCIQGADKNGDGKVDTSDNDLTAKAAIARQSGGLRMFKKYDTTGPTPYPPAAQDDAATTNENTPVTINVLANDSDPNGDPVSVTGVTQGAHGQVVNNGNSVTYRPATNYYGDDQFTYTASDPGGLSATATVKVTVKPFCPALPTGSFSDDAETAKPGYATTNNRTTGGWAQMLDPTAHSARQSWTALDEQPGVPTNTAKDATLVLPAQDLGTTSLLTFWHNYDFARFPLSAVATRYQSGGVLEISADGNAWVDLGDFIQTGGYNGKVADTAQNPLKGRAGWVGSSDGDLQPGRVDAMKQVVVNLGAAIQQKYGVTELRGARIRFRLGGTFQLLLGGIQGTGWGVDDIEVRNTLQVSDCNRPPLAEDDAATTMRNTSVRVNVLANDSDPENDTVTVTGVGQPSHGRTQTNGDGTITYTPATNYVGGDQFTYTVSDGHSNTDTAAVSVTVNDTPNHAPTAAADSTTTQQDTPVTLNVLANDTDPDGDTLTVTGVAQGAHGAVTNNNDGTLTYTPNAGFYGTDGFSYYISDGRNGTATGNVTVTVNRVVQNAPPDAVDDSATTTENTPVKINVLANDTDPNGDPLTVTSTSHGSNGTVANNGNGTVTYTPNAGFAGSDQFTYTVGDGKGGADTATVTVIVNQAPGSTGRTSGGGWLPASDKKTNFNFDVKSGSLAKGKLSYDNSAANVWLNGTVESLKITGTAADFGGACRLGDGSAGRYTAHVEDNGEPGIGADRFSIKVYNAAGVLIHQTAGTLGGGNIQVK